MKQFKLKSAALCIASLFCLHGMAQEQKTIFKGIVSDYQGKGTLIFISQTPAGQSVDTIRLSADGRFEHELKGITQNRFCSIVFNYLDGKSLRCYIMPGATLEMNVTSKKENIEIEGVTFTNLILTPAFKGMGAKESQYLNFPHFQTYKMVDEAGNAVSYKNYIAQIKALQKSRYEALEGTVLEFRETRIPGIENLLKGREFSYAWQLKAAGKSVQEAAKDADFMAYVNSLEVNKAGNTEVADEVIRFKMEAYPDVYKGINRVAHYFCFLRDSLTNEETKATLANRRMGELLRRGFPGMDKVFEIYKPLAIGTKGFEKNEKLYKESAKFMPGNPVSDFTMQDDKGQTIRLHDVIGKGKIVYIDFWATWCGPCVMEIPFVEKLVEKYKGHNDRIEFISISLDQDINKWKKKLAEDKPTWRQFLAPKDFNQTFAKEYNISGIPRFMLFDAEGKIITISAPNPSSGQCEPLFNKLLAQ